MTNDACGPAAGDRLSTLVTPQLWLATKDYSPRTLAPFGALPGQFALETGALETGFRSRLPRHLLENSLYDAGTDSERSSDLENAVTLSPQFQDPLLHRGFNPASA